MKFSFGQGKASDCRRVFTQGITESLRDVCRTQAALITVCFFQFRWILTQRKIGPAQVTKHLKDVEMQFTSEKMDKP